MSYMKQTDRLHLIIEQLRGNALTIHDLKKNIDLHYSSISLRQIQRDLIDIEKFLTNQEEMKTFRRNYLKYYMIQRDVCYKK